MEGFNYFFVKLFYVMKHMFEFLIQGCHFTWKNMENLEFDNLGKKNLEKPGI